LAAVPPAERPIPSYIAEPPQEALPYGRWGEALADRFRAAFGEISSDEDLGAVGDVRWFPDRSWEGRTYIPASATTTTGFEVFGYVSFSREHEGAEATEFYAVADYTDETAEANPDWSLDLSDQELGHWRGPEGRRGEITLVWGIALVPHGAVATTELGPTTTDQCVLVEDRFTLVSLDNYTGDYIEVRLYGEGGAQLAAESLYEED
jgi:hypothetical protein